MELLLVCGFTAACIAIGINAKKIKDLEIILRATDIELRDLKKNVNKERNKIDIWEHDN